MTISISKNFEKTLFWFDSLLWNIFLNLLFWKHSGKICFNLFCFSCPFLSNVWYEMPIYRTNSDRGLWKKYREPQPQHFHKPNYLELDKSKPQVSLVFNYSNQPLKRDWIKRLKLRRSSKLDFTCNGKLRPPQLIYCGSAVYKPQYTSHVVGLGACRGCIPKPKISPEWRCWSSNLLYNTCKCAITLSTVLTSK